ncbi:MAG: FAD:protein FMN transferase, partial [Anaerovoracaceae bacterium]
DGMLADGLSTALFVKGLEGAKEYWQKHGKDFDLILVDHQGRIYVSEPIAEAFSSEAPIEKIKQ